MKRNYKLVCLLIFAVVFSIKSQNSIADFLPVKASKVEFTNVIEKKGGSMEAFMELASQWMKDQKIKDLQISYPDEKRVRLKGRWSTTLLWGPNDFKELYKDLKCDIEIIAKKDRYQYRFSNFVVQEPGREIQLEIYKSDENKMSKYNEDFYKRINVELINTIEGLNRKMSAP